MLFTAQRGLVHLCTFTLLYMSGEREFGVQLNKPFLRRLTIDLPTFSGNYADYLILVITVFIFTSREDTNFPIFQFSNFPGSA